jgi:hypothetical protein
MKYDAQVLKLDDDVEEQVVIQVGNAQLTCFASVCPYAIHPGQHYPVELELFVAEDFVMTEFVDAQPNSLAQCEPNGLGYVITGQLNGDQLSVGELIFKDSVFQTHFAHLQNKKVQLKVDRIDVEFL